MNSLPGCRARSYHFRLPIQPEDGEPATILSLEQNYSIGKDVLTFVVQVDYLVATEREAIAAEAEKYKASLLSPDPGCQYDQVHSDYASPSFKCNL